MAAARSYSDLLLSISMSRHTLGQSWTRKIWVLVEGMSLSSTRRSLGPWATPECKEAQASGHARLAARSSAAAAPPVAALYTECKGHEVVPASFWLSA